MSAHFHVVFPKLDELKRDPKPFRSFAEASEYMRKQELAVRGLTWELEWCDDKRCLEPPSDE
jgi:hypothetical protein